MHIRPLALIAVTLMSCAAAHAGSGYVTLRVVTLNVKEGLIGPSGSAYGATSDMITTVDQNPSDGDTGLNPDVVCFQELDFDSVATLTAYRDAFLPGFTIHAPTSAGDGFNYQAILVRPDITVLQTGTTGGPSPRNPIYVSIAVPGSDEVVRIYTAHFKAFGDSSSQATRASQADALGSRVQSDLATGFVSGVPIENQHVIVAGDLNSNNNNDGTLDGLFTVNAANTCCAPEDGSADANFLIAFGVDCSTMSPCCVPDVSPGLCNAAGGTLTTVPIDTGLVDIVYESISSSQFSGTSQTGTFSNSRLDYILANQDLAFRFDDDMDMIVDQGEANQIGFVYRSEQNVSGVHVSGQFANGNNNATNNASDHRPVVAEFRFEEAAPVGGCCIMGSCMVLTETNCLAMLGTYLGDASDCSSSPCAPINDCAADFDGDGDVDLTDFGAFGAAFGSMTGDINFDVDADFDSDGDVDLTDFGAFGAEFGRSDCLSP